MVLNNIQTHIAYRCHRCGTAIYGFIGKFALKAGMVRLKCNDCDSALDVTVSSDGKLRLSVPCLFCGKNHHYTVSESIFFGRELFLLNCPYSNMDIAFIGEKERIDGEVIRTRNELTQLFADLEISDPREIQPEDLDDNDVLPDPAVYDALRFLVKELEADEKIDCPCHNGSYELRFCPEGVQVYCERCGAVYTFDTRAEHSYEDYLNLDSITLA